MNIDCMCQCTSLNCVEMFRVKSSFIDDMNSQGYVLISDDCLVGLSDSDTIVELCNGYSICKQGPIQGLITGLIMSLLD